MVIPQLLITQLLNYSMTLPLVSIITPSFNQAKFLEQTIQSVLNQDYPHIEYIIIDGGSADGSVDIIKKYEDKIRYWVSEQDAGQTEAINKGFAKATGEILAWINSDDSYNPNAISEAVKFLVENPQVGMVYADCNFIDENENVIGKFNAKQTNYQMLRRGSAHIPQQTMFFRKQFWSALDTTFYFAMDYDLWTRIAKQTEIKYLQGNVWANFRIHTSSKTNVNDMRGWDEMLRVHYRDGGSVFSVIVAKYYLRKVIGPLWKWRIKR